MSDYEDEDDFGVAGDDHEEKEEEILQLRSLINSVQPCPALYAKSKKKYSGKNFSKDLAWTSVGQAQVPPLSGIFSDIFSFYHKNGWTFGTR